ncbi:MAG: PDC sensor domain-containing protein [Candidatus Bathyarchaeota archaeon]|nr:PDC sensor domain-containing protein [Candidatus Bathyarchaeota archaeon]
MSKSELAAIILAVALIASVAANIYLLAQTAVSASAAKVEMVNTLSQIQTQIDAELTRIGQSLAYAAKQLSTTGLTGDQANAVLAKLAANSSYIINAATENLDNTIVAVAPQNWSQILGRNVGEQVYLNPNPYGEVTPVMSPVIALQSDIMGNALAAPIFDSQNRLIGAVSVIFDPQTLIGNTAASALSGKPYELIGMQLDGMMIYDSDPTQQWRNMFTDPAYQGFAELLALGHRVVDAPSGYGTYRFTLADSSTVVHKECYWSSVWAFGQQWRLALNHALQ